MILTSLQEAETGNFRQNFQQDFKLAAYSSTNGSNMGNQKQRGDYIHIKFGGDQ